MSRNIKEIGKELMGKSLNSFHKKTGLTQLEENNKMQDGILDGILSQVDDAYIEKTEQSNVIRLDGSGDGVVEVGKVVGNTMVNLWNRNNLYASGTSGLTILSDRIRITTNDTPYYNFWLRDFSMFKPSTQYTIIVNIYKTTAQPNDKIVVTSKSETSNDVFNIYTELRADKLGVTKFLKVTTENYSNVNLAMRSYFLNASKTVGSEVELSFIVLEGDYISKPLPNEYFEGMKSTFEDCLVTQEMIDAGTEKAENLNKYKAELKVVGKNLFHYNLPSHYGKLIKKIPNGYELNIDNVEATTGRSFRSEPIRVKQKTKYILSTKIDLSNCVIEPDTVGSNIDIVGENGKWITGSTIATQKEVKISKAVFDSGNFNNIRLQFFVRAKISGIIRFLDIQLEEVFLDVETPTPTPYEPYKENTHILYLNEPLYKDNELCVYNGQLGYWKNRERIVLDGSDDENWRISGANNDDYTTLFFINDGISKISNSAISDKFRVITSYTAGNPEGIKGDKLDINIRISNSKATDLVSFKQWLQVNPTTVMYELAEPIFIPVENEYGKPILLEGYENGTLYIDSNIVPTTTTRYTPKMGSVRTLKEVNNDNRTLYGDINNNIIPYMMDVDFMITEKEMALTSHKNTFSRIGENNMTSMQKRTKEMLERLFKGKSLTKEECLTRITVYLSAGKITDEQAEELILLIEEIYG